MSSQPIPPRDHDAEPPDEAGSGDAVDWPTSEAAPSDEVPPATPPPATPGGEDPPATPPPATPDQDEVPPATPPPPPPPSSSPPPPSSTAPPSPSVPAPRTPASAVTPESRNWATVAHLSPFVAVVIGFAFVGPLVVWLVKRDEDPFVEHHAREALNFQLTWFLGGLVGGIIAAVIGLVTFGLALVVIVPAAIVLGLAWIVIPIVAAARTRSDEGYRYPLSIRLIT